MKRILTIVALAIAISWLISGHKVLGHKATLYKGHDQQTGKGAQTDGQNTKRELPEPDHISEPDPRHIVAYYSKGENRLFVFNQGSLAAGIKKGVFHVTWKSGAARATLLAPATAPGGKQTADRVRYNAEVVYGESPGGFRNNPEIGDTRYLERQHVKFVPQKKGPCNVGTGDLGAWRFVVRTYEYLDDRGLSYGTETYEEYGKFYNYSDDRCAKLQSEDQPSLTWMFWWGPWPKP